MIILAIIAAFIVGFVLGSNLGIRLWRSTFFPATFGEPPRFFRRGLYAPGRGLRIVEPDDHASGETDRG